MASQISTRLLDLLPQPKTDSPVTLESFLRDGAPAFFLYFATAFLVQVPKTFFIRLSLLPISLWAIARASTHVDFVSGLNDDRYLYIHQGWMIMMITFAFRVVVWTFRTEPLRPLQSRGVPNGSAGPSDKSMDIMKTLINSIDLGFNLRGIGWKWSQGVYIPKETRPTSSRLLFTLATILSFIINITIFDTLHYSVQTFGPDTIATPLGGSIFDDSLPPLHRYTRSSFITLLCGMTIWYSLETLYDLFTIIGVLVFWQSPLQWPPLFDAPWKATSVTEFWSRRWHQLFRDNFLSIGAKPMPSFLGRPGGLLGAFFVSGVMHVVGLWRMGKGGAAIPYGGFFIIMGIGSSLEYTWGKLTGTRVRGPLGYVWSFIWIISWGNLVAESWCTRGLVGSAFMPDHVRPVYRVLQLLSYLDGEYTSSIIS